MSFWLDLHDFAFCGLFFDLEFTRIWVSVRLNAQGHTVCLLPAKDFGMEVCKTLSMTSNATTQARATSVPSVLHLISPFEVA